jgi:hypothetical protein
MNRVFLKLMSAVTIALLVCSCIVQQKPAPVKNELPVIPKYSGTPFKLNAGETSPTFIIIACSDGKTEENTLKTLKKELGLINVDPQQQTPQQQQQIIQLKNKIAALELVVSDYNLTKLTTESIKKNIESAGFKIVSGYQPSKNITAAYLEKIKNTNSQFCDKQFRPEEYYLSAVLNDICDTAVEYDYNFNSQSRNGIDRVVVVRLQETREIYDSNNYGCDVQFQIEIYNAKDSRQLGQVMVWSRYLNELNAPLTNVKLNNERKYLDKYRQNAIDQIPANLMKMQEFKQLMLNPAPKPVSTDKSTTK